MKHQARFCVFVAGLLVSGLFEGVELATKSSVWVRIGGVALFLAALLLSTVALFWLARPVDEEALEQMMKRREMNRLPNIWKQYRKSRRSRSAGAGDHE